MQQKLNFKVAASVFTSFESDHDVPYPVFIHVTNHSFLCALLQLLHSPTIAFSTMNLVFGLPFSLPTAGKLLYCRNYGFVIPMPSPKEGRENGREGGREGKSGEERRI